jgi:signal transduction histidine kinase/ActR/RegA family two-component response regulator
VNLAVLIPVCSATVNLASGIVLVAISRAPGWRALRMSAAIAFTAGAYCLTAVTFGVPGLDTSVYVSVARATYVCGYLHAIAWLVFAFGGPEASPREVPPSVGWLAVVLAAVALFTATGAHLQQRIEVVDVAWAGMKYHYPVATPAGDALGLVIPGVMALVLWQLARRARRGERDLRWHVGGFVIFLLTVVDEVLVANRVIVFVSLADLGVVAVVLPLTISMVRRVIADAGRLSRISATLESEVRQRTEERDSARDALVESERLAALGRLAAGVGHEVNNPLTYMQLALEDVRRYAAESDVPEAVREAVANAEDGARRIQKVVEGLRSYSRRQDDFAPLDLREVARAAMKVAWPRIRHVAAVDSELDAATAVVGDEASLVQAAVNLLTNAAQAVEGSGGAGVPPAGSGGAGVPPAARIIIRTGGRADGSATLAVSDNGPGIPPEMLARISEPYFTTRSKTGGLGLGLFITRGIVDAHGGRLVVDSTIGRGTTMTIVLPPAGGAGVSLFGGAGVPPVGGAGVSPAAGLDFQLAAEAAGAAVSQPASSGGAGFQPTGGAGVSPAGGAGFQRTGWAGVSPATPVFELTASRGRLLLVDDEALVRDLLARALGRSWDVATAATGEEALRLLEAGPFDAIVCDLMMPGMSGMDVAEAVWARDPRLRSRMVFLTGGAVLPDAEAFLERPDVRHFVKPVRLAELNAALQDLVAGGRTDPPAD